MSRTYKDSKRSKLKRYYEERWDTEHEAYEYEAHRYVWPDYTISDGKSIRIRYLKKAGVLTKKRRGEDTEDHWMSTPGWWIRMTMTRPERRDSHLREQKALREIDLEDVDFPDLRRKPHIYYW